jgi:serine/threonine protein kinase
LLLRIDTVLAGERGENQYEVKSFIGSGMNAEVYKVLDHNDNSTKAMKVSSDALMLEREAEAAKKIIHPNVTRYFEYREAVIDNSKVHCIIMEHVPDGDMRERINKQLESGEFFALDLLLGWMSQLASGLSAINDSLIHRDLKPENILFLRDTPKISDFGLSKYVEEATRTQTYKGEGTHPYMAPETWELAPQSIQTDIYSLGIIFYELVTLQRPFEAQNWLAWSQQHRFILPPHPIKKNSQIGHVVDGMIRRMIEKEPSKRYQLAEEVLRVIEQYSADITGEKPTIIPDSLVTAARQKYDNESEKARVAKLEQDRRQELNQKFDYGFQEIVGVLDNIVNEFNQQIQVAPIQRSAPPRHPNYIQFNYFDRRLVINALPLIDAISQMDRQDKNKIEEKGLIGAAYLRLSCDGEHRQGVNFILVLEQGKMYGSWKTCEIRDHALIGRQQPYQPFAVDNAKELLRDLIMHCSGVMDIHTVSIKDFSQDDFMPFFQELVSA